jgi:hypothetical protein
MPVKKGIHCKCGRTTHDHADLVVTMRNATKKASIAGYSEVKCLRPGCKGRWATVAKYVNDLPDMEGLK